LFLQSLLPLACIFKFCRMCVVICCICNHSRACLAEARGGVSFFARVPRHRDENREPDENQLHTVDPPGSPHSKKLELSRPKLQYKSPCAARRGTRLRPVLERMPPTKWTRQVHPTARSESPRHPTFNTTCLCAVLRSTRLRPVLEKAFPHRTRFGTSPNCQISTACSPATAANSFLSHTPDRGSARFTPQQEAKAPATAFSMQFTLRPIPK
jgi:hypothetical protein